MLAINNIAHKHLSILNNKKNAFALKITHSMMGKNVYLAIYQSIGIMKKNLAYNVQNIKFTILNPNNVNIAHNKLHF